MPENHQRDLRSRYCPPRRPLTLAWPVSCLTWQHRWELFTAPLRSTMGAYSSARRTAELMLHVLEPLQVGYGAVSLGRPSSCRLNTPSSRSSLLSTCFTPSTAARPRVAGLHRGYSSYRFILTFIVGASIVVSLIGRGQIADRIGTSSNTADHVRELTATEKKPKKGKKSKKSEDDESCHWNLRTDNCRSYVTHQTARCYNTNTPPVHCAYLRMAPSKQYIGAIDAGTTSARFIIFTLSGEPVAQHQLEFEQIHKNSGWHEHDPAELLSSVETCIEEACKEFTSQGHDIHEIVAIGVTNQRETTVVWDWETGAAIGNAIACRTRGRRRWCNVKEVKETYEKGRLAFGTVDTWLLYNLTGGKKDNGVFVTDTTNASRTMFMNLHEEEIRRGASRLLRAGYQEAQAAEDRRIVSCGSLRQVRHRTAERNQDHRRAWGPERSTRSGRRRYDFGEKFGVAYALEGSIAVAGSAVKFLIKNMGLAESSHEITDLASTVDDNGGCVFVTAFSGLFAPYWIDDAKGTIFGITQHTQRGHIARATLEAVCYQSKAILDAMEKDSEKKLAELAVDGGMSSSDLCMQTQANILGIPVDRPKMMETTALGSAIAAGLAVGLWGSFDELKHINQEGRKLFKPNVTKKESARMYRIWTKAVEMCRGWMDTETATDQDPEDASA
ncbi:hypothetical protein MRB53_037291 [Persea americana]|nr:hypothetical protein MRB53_037291 [Persea americana]